MASIVYQIDKKTGAKYAFESVSYWDKEKKQPRSKRKYLGKVDPETGEPRPARLSLPEEKLHMAQTRQLMAKRQYPLCGMNLRRKIRSFPDCERKWKNCQQGTRNC